MMTGVQIPSTYVNIKVWQSIPIISVLEGRRQEDAWGLLASQSNRILKLQACDRPCLKKYDGMIGAIEEGIQH